MCTFWEACMSASSAGLDNIIDALFIQGENYIWNDDVEGFVIF